MKFKTSRKAIVEGTPKSALFAVGYCDMAYLLCYHSPIAYTCGVYGWNFDVYEVYGLTICTGYRNMPGRNLVGVKEYEEAARKITTSDHPWDYQKEEIENLLKELCIKNGGAL